MTGFEDVVYALVRRRYALGLTQQNVADRCGVSKPSIAMFENPKYRTPLLSTVVRYAAAVGATITIQETP